MVTAQDAPSARIGAYPNVKAPAASAFFYEMRRVGYLPATMVRVVGVQPGTELLAKIKGLWRRHSDTLGFFPEGAFDEYARKNCVLAAIDQDASLLGYTLFRTTHRRKTSIAHLCVDQAARGKGVARQLFDAMKPLVRNSDDIIVRCRRDFEANALWPRLGFISVDEEYGRGRDAQVVTIWRYELNRLPLLAAMDKPRGDVMPVAIDANVFYDLDPQGGNAHEESKALAADWLGGFIELCLTEEIYNEINRREDPAHRARQWSRVKQFRVLPSNKLREEQVLAELELLFPSWRSASDNSDMRQLTRAIAGGVTYFVTRDERVRDQAEHLYNSYGLVVVSPFELVLEFDELRREEEYRPKRFVSVGLKTVKPRGPEDLERIADLMHLGQPAPEPRRRTISRLRDLLASTDRFDLTCVTSNDGTFLAAYAIEYPAPEVLRIPLFAAAESALGRTAARHFAEKLVSLAATKRCRVVEVTEGTGGQRIDEALLDSGFSKEGNQWIKLVVPLVARTVDLSAELDRIACQLPGTRNLANRIAVYLRAEREPSAVRLENLALVERALWPAKVSDAALPCYVVPIRPHWAKELFDAELAAATLWGARDPKLAMNSENAYYRAAKAPFFTPPARILWYVSDNKNFQGTKAIRASSYLDQVVVARPKDAFKRFRRLGVYEWEDVIAAAKHDPTRNIMAFQFSKSELFARPVAFTAVQEVLRKHTGKGSPLVSVAEIPEPCFLELYKLGTGGA